MINQIDSNTIYLLIFFILPGFLSYSINSSLYKKSKQATEVEITYRSLFYSSIIYTFLYIIASYNNIELYKFPVNYPIISVLIILTISSLFGIILYCLNEYEVFASAISKVIKPKVEPPNLYAALFDPNYSLKASKGAWLIYEKDGLRREGYVALTDVIKGNSLIYITEIKDLDENDQAIKTYSNEFGVLLDLRSIESCEIIYTED